MSQEISGPGDFSQQDWQELYEIKEQVDQTAEETGIPRRDILKGAGLLAAGSLAGGISAQQAIERFVQTAEADASTSDSDGNVGTPTDRVDVFADGVDTISVSTDGIQVANKSYINHITDFKESGGATVSLSSFNSLSSSVSTRQLIVTLSWDDKGVQQDLYLRFNGDGPSTGNYNYVDEAGTESTSENEMLLTTETSGFGGAVLKLEIGRVFHTVVDVEGTVRFDRATQVAQRGSRTENVDLSSIELVQSSGTDGLLQGRLYERVIA